MADDVPNLTPDTSLPQDAEQARAAFAAIFCPHLPRLRRFVHSRIGRSSPHSVDDVVQEIALRAWRNFHRMQNARAPLAYLLGIARNVVVDHFRTVRGPFSELDEDLEDAIPSPDLQLTLKEQSEHLTAAMESLPEAQRQALQLRQQGLSYREIAARVGRTEKAVECLLARASAKLDEGLAE